MLSPSTDLSLDGGSETGWSSPSRFRLGMDPRALAFDRRRIEQDLRAALEAEALVLHYQPRLCMLNNEWVAGEALIRWPHRKRGLISPSVFIPIAERSELAVRIGGWVLREACASATRWPAQPGGAQPGAASPVVSVNISPRQLNTGALPAQVATALEETGLQPERLELELTETMFVENDTETLLALSAIRDLGVGLALDNFGTGHASLAMLKRLPLTTLKLDRCLVRELPGDPEDCAIVRAVVQTAHAMGLTVVAEGIEQEAQRLFLAATGCDQGQGFLFSPAVPEDGLARALKSASAR